MNKSKVLILVLTLVVLFMLSCTEESNKSKEEIINARNKEYVKYFHKRELIPNKTFSHMQTKFKGEISGDAIEIVSTLQRIENARGHFYKVFYNRFGKILRYKLFEKGEFVSSARYKYKRELKDKTKLESIEYYDKVGKVIAWDIIIYDQVGKPKKTIRYKGQGNKLINIF